MLGGTFNADMLLLARGAREMTQAEAATSSGITQAMLSKVENRLVQPSGEVAMKLAKTLGFPVEFFYQEERAHGFPHFHHRKRNKLGAKTLDKIHALINIRRQHIVKLLRSYEAKIDRPIPLIDLDEKGFTPVDVARMMREYWMLPRGPIDSVIAVIEGAGGIVIVSDFGTALLDGISFRMPGLPPIFVMNKNVPGDRFRFSLAHELGHMIMHNIPDNDEAMEGHADEFASAFLAPGAEVRPHLMPPAIAKFARAKLYWKVSIKFLIRRAYDLKLMTPHQYKVLNIDYSKAGYNSGEPNPIPLEQPSLIGKVIQFHMKELGYTASDLASLLLMEEGEFHQTYLPRRSLELIVSN
jgi:Zn-dependent peptidase ImmA (M78 family)/transcriptional regulator with XRE-family HTH domain